MIYVHSCNPSRRRSIPVAWLLLLLGLMLASCSGRDGGAEGDPPPTILPPPADTIAPPPIDASPEPVNEEEAASIPTPDAPVSATATDAVVEPPPPATQPPPTAAPTPTITPTPTPTPTPEPFAGGGASPADAGIAAVLEFSVPLGSPTMKLRMPAPVEGGWPDPEFVRDVVLLDSRDMRFGRMFVGPDVPIVLEGWDEYRELELEVIDPTGDGTNHRARPGNPDEDGGGFVLRILPPAALGTWTLRAKQGNRLFSVGTFDLVSPNDPRLWVELSAPRDGRERELKLFGAGYPAEAEASVHLYEVFETIGPDESIADIMGTEREIYQAVYAGDLGTFATNGSGQASHRFAVPQSARPSCWLVQTDPPALAENTAFGPRMHMFHTWAEPEEGRFGFEAACRQLDEY